jgi:ribonuclease J
VSGARGPVSVTFLGGLGDIGRNCAVLEHDDRMVVLDCGVLFAGPAEPGVDAVLPDLGWLEERADRVEAVVFTHGHEDHIGAAVHLARIVDVPMYGSPFTLALVRHKLEEAGLGDGREYREVRDGDQRRVGPFRAEFLPITHSIPWGFATAFRTPQGIILHSGDYKLDPDPVDGRLSDLARIDQLADDPGIRLLLADSTNSLDEGESGDERSVGKVLRQIVDDRPDRRIIVACFSSHIHRVQQAVEAAMSNDRVVAPVGRSLERNVRIARELGLLDLPDDHLIDAEQVESLDPGDVMVLTTGSQGEEMAGLALMARGSHRSIGVTDRDTVVFSSTPIPGNEHAIDLVVDGLVRHGVEIVDHRQLPVHVSGHARRGEIRTLLRHARPEWFVPVHGEYRHLLTQAELARETGVAGERALVAVDGDRVVLDDDGLTLERAGEGTYRYVHGSIDDITDSLLQERQILGREGEVTIVVVIDADRRELVAPPRLVTRGWVDRSLSAALLGECEGELATDLERALHAGTNEPSDLERLARRTVGRFVSDRTRRRPMLVPAILFV